MMTIPDEPAEVKFIPTVADDHPFRLLLLRDPNAFWRHDPLLRIELAHDRDLRRGQNKPDGTPDYEHQIKTLRAEVRALAEKIGQTQPTAEIVTLKLAKPVSQTVKVRRVARRRRSA